MQNQENKQQKDQLSEILKKMSGPLPVLEPEWINVEKVELFCDYFGILYDLFEFVDMRADMRKAR